MPMGRFSSGGKQTLGSIIGVMTGVFLRYERLCFNGGIPYRPSFKSRCLSLPGNKKAPYFYDAFVLLRRRWPNR